MKSTQNPNSYKIAKTKNEETVKHGLLIKYGKLW